jgi:16S rRNA (cytidine1402-2'-O)-methyltransferase
LCVGRAEPSPNAADWQNPLAPGLYVTATPIGHARDITLRALDVLKGCDVIAAEDTRVTAKLLAIHGISKPLLAYNDHNAARERPRLIARLQGDARIALVSDAGTPLVSDPGYKLVRAAIEQGIHVEAIPGASALLTALVLAGLPTDRFLFAGFLPAKPGERRTVLEELKSVPASLVFFESPRRIAECLADMTDVLGDRAAAVGRELTKLHEDVRRGNLASLAKSYTGEEAPKGEVTIVVGPAPAAAPDFALIDSLLGQALAFMPVRAAADLVAEATHAPRRAVYDRALELKKSDDG